MTILPAGTHLKHKLLTDYQGRVTVSFERLSSSCGIAKNLLTNTSGWKLSCTQRLRHVGFLFEGAPCQCVDSIEELSGLGAWNGGLEGQMSSSRHHRCRDPALPECMRQGRGKKSRDKSNPAGHHRSIYPAYCIEHAQSRIPSNSSTASCTGTGSKIQTPCNFI